jgi:hypothetical protein
MKHLDPQVGAGGQILARPWRSAEPPSG